MSSTRCSPENLPQTVAQLLFEAAAKHADRIAIQEADIEIRYRELPERVMEVTRALIAEGVRKGDRIAVWAPNGIDWIILALGLQCAGAILVPLNTRMKGIETTDILDRSGTSLVFAQREFLGNDYPAMLAEHRTGRLQKVVVIGCGAARTREQSLNDFLRQGEDVSTEAARNAASNLRAEDTADLLFTSGTTGRPKGVMYSHGQNMRMYHVYADALGYRAGDRYLIVNPFFHSFGYKAGWLTCLTVGATILPEPVFDAERVFQRIVREKITLLPGPPTLYQTLLNHPQRDETDLSSLRMAVTGASTIPPVLIERVRSELGCNITTAYGLTECGGVATICDPNERAEVIAGTSGKPIPGTELRIVDQQNRPVPQGETGEICLRGFHVMQGYFDDSDATAEAIDAAGWLHTGDLGSLDIEGNVRITGRLKDMFIVGGFNCYPAEIEAALLEHPAVAQAAVIGIPDERMGEVGCACLVLRPGRLLDEQEMIAWSRHRMANYKVPRRVLFYASFPVNATNKVDKLTLKKLVLPQII
ncbi:AMP-binding protein [Proteobacteria bacterium 005FR1]|nr:AMP-binding protein [Proteobacteria bacterium 005FR1]